MGLAKVLRKDTRPTLRVLVAESAPNATDRATGLDNAGHSVYLQNNYWHRKWSAQMPLPMSLAIFLVLTQPIVIVLFFIHYIRYYKYIKANHAETFQGLMNRDPFVDTIGEWIRAPIGSIYLFASIFQLSKTKNCEDATQVKLKIKSVTFLVLYFVNMLLVALLLSTLGGDNT